MYFQNLTIEDVKQYLQKKKTIVLPLGSVEAHGLHLPIGTDNLILNRFLEEINKNGIMIAPIQVYSPVNFAREQDLEKFGTTNIEPEKWVIFTKEYIQKFAKIGFEEFIILSWHDTKRFIEAINKLIGELSNLKIKNIRLWPMAVEVCKNNKIPVPEKERHAAFIETSLILWINQKLVRKSKIKRGEYIDKEIPKSLDKSGIYGDPTLSKAKYGKQIFELTLKRFLKEIN